MARGRGTGAAPKRTRAGSDGAMSDDIDENVQAAITRAVAAQAAAGEARLQAAIKDAATEAAKQAVSLVEPRVVAVEKAVEIIEDKVDEHEERIAKQDERITKLERAIVSGSGGSTGDSVGLLTSEPRAAEANVLRLVCSIPCTIEEVTVAFLAEVKALQNGASVAEAVTIAGPREGGERFKAIFRQPSDRITTGAAAAKVFRNSLQESPGVWKKPTFKRQDQEDVELTVFADRSSWDSLASAITNTIDERIRGLEGLVQDHNIHRTGMRVLLGKYDTLVSIESIRGTHEQKFHLGKSTKALEFLVAHSIITELLQQWATERRIQWSL